MKQGHVSLFSHVPRIYHASNQGIKGRRRKEGRSKEHVCPQTPPAQKMEPCRGARIFVSRAISQRSQIMGLGREEGDRRNGMDLKPGAHRGITRKPISWALFAASGGAKGHNPKSDANKLICHMGKKKERAKGQCVLSHDFLSTPRLRATRPHSASSTRPPAFGFLLRPRIRTPASSGNGAGPGLT